MDTNKKIELLGFNTSQQTDFVLYDLISNHCDDEFLHLIKEQCYPVSAFVLNVLLDFDKEHLIMTVLKECKSYNHNIYEWLCIYMGKEEAEKFFCLEFDDSDILKEISDEGLVENQKWDTLVKLRKWEVLQTNRKWDLLYEQVVHHGVDYKYMIGGFDYLIEQKDQNLAFRMICKSPILIVFYDAFSRIYRENPTLGNNQLDFISFYNTPIYSDLLEKLLQDEFYVLINMCGRFDFLAKNGKAHHIDFDKMFSLLLGNDVADIFVIMAENGQWDLLLKYKEKVFELKSASCSQLSGICRKLKWKIFCSKFR